MNSDYSFFIDSENNLVCEVTNIHGVNYYLNNDALRKFQMLDAYSFNCTRLSKHNITVKNNIVSLSIASYNDFFKAGLMNYIPNNKEYIVEAIRRYKHEQHRKKKLQQIKQAVSVAVVTASVAVIIGLGAHALGEMNDEKLADENPDLGKGEVYIEPSYEKDSSVSIQTEQGSFLIDDSVQTTLENKETQKKGSLPNEAISQNQPVVEEENVAYLDFEHNRDSEKGNHAYDNYYGIVDKYSNKWGVSANVIMGMLTQESGGYYTNLMQIQFSSWENQVITVYNFEAGKYEKLVLTDNPNEFKQKYGDIITISRSELENPITNISVGTVLLRESARVMQNHIGASIQCYNFGYGNMMKVLNETSRQTGVPVETILANQENIDFVKYTNIINAGDPNYLANVMQYTNDLNEGFTLKEIDENGNIIYNQIKILPSSSLGR